MNNLEVKNIIFEKDESPAIHGGYLYIYSQDDLVKIASIPSPNPITEDNNDPLVTNEDNFMDSAGNEYQVIIESSLFFLKWSIIGKNIENDNYKNLKAEVKYSDY